MIWTPEELREMAAADAAIDAEFEVDLELSRQLDLAALDDRLDAKHLHKLQWQRAYYQAHKETILRQNRESRERTGYVRKIDPDRHREQSRDWYQRNREQALAKKKEYRQRVAADPEKAAHIRELQRRRYQKQNARRRERRATDPEYRERINAQKREAYRKKKEGDLSGISEQR